MKLSNLKELLIQKVTDQIEKDIKNKEYDSLDELLRFIPVDYLIGYLSESEWEQFKDLLQGREMYVEPKLLSEI